MARNREAVIVGAGLVGSLLSIFLARRGMRVTIYERLPDLRRPRAGVGRSINLVATRRGFDALDRVGLTESIRALTVPVRGRMIHALDGELAYQPYGKDESECNYSISRKQLNEFLISAAEERGVRCHFDRKLTGADLEKGLLTFSDEAGATSIEVQAPLVLGADGAVSAVRAALMRQPGSAESVELIDHDYMELLIPVEEGKQLAGNALHIWPRGNIMLMALPNLDGSFTVTLYLPRSGPDSFEILDNADRVRSFFDRHFPDTVPLIPDLAASFLASPTGNLGTVKCYPWHYKGRAALIGDAAHAIVPFFGQGMNCGFEDCSVLDEQIDRHGLGNWERVFAGFAEARKPNTDAIADMALENFVEMRDRVGDPRFLLRKQVEHLLEQEMPLLYRSRYSMVMYSNIPYRVALEAGLIQQQILEQLCDGLQQVGQLDLDRARQLIGERLTPYLHSRSASLDY